MGKPFLNFNFWDIGFFLSLFVFILLKISFGINTPIFDMEEVLKLHFLVNDIDLSFFIPGRHGDSAFYGHSPLLGLILYAVTSVFGKSILVVRLSFFIISILIIISFYYVFSKHFKKETAFFSVVTFLSMPMFFVQSNLLNYELLALLFTPWAIHYFYQRKWFLFSIFMVLSALALESYVSLSITVILWAILSKSFYKSLSLKERIYILLPLFFLLLYIGSNVLIWGQFSTHNSVVGKGLVEQIFSIFFRRTNYEVSLHGLWLTYLDNGVGLSLFFAMPLIIFQSSKFKNNFKKWTLSITALQFLTFFLLFNLYSGGRDYYFVLMVSFLLIYSSSFIRKEILWALFILTIFLNFNSMNRHKRWQTTYFQSSFNEYKNAKRFELIKSTVQKQFLNNDRPLKCYISSYLTGLICSSFYGVAKSGEFNLVKKMEKADFNLIGIPKKFIPTKEEYKYYKIFELDEYTDVLFAFIEVSE